MPHPDYPCENCVNNSSPLCKVCVTVNLGRPNYYIPHREVHLLADKKSPTRSIARCLVEQKPIPIAWVIAHNKEVDKNEG